MDLRPLLVNLPRLAVRMGITTLVRCTVAARSVGKLDRWALLLSNTLYRRVLRALWSAGLYCRRVIRFDAFLGRIARLCSRPLWSRSPCTYTIPPAVPEGVTCVDAGGPHIFPQSPTTPHVVAPPSRGTADSTAAPPTISVARFDPRPKSIGNIPPSPLGLNGSFRCPRATDTPDTILDIPGNASVTGDAPLPPYARLTGTLYSGLVRLCRPLWWRVPPTHPVHPSEPPVQVFFCNTDTIIDIERTLYGRHPRSWPSLVLWKVAHLLPGLTSSLMVAPNPHAAGTPCRARGGALRRRTLS